MARKGFIFELQPLLDTAVEEKQACEDAKLDAARELREQLDRQELLTAELRSALQQVADTRDHLARCRDPQVADSLYSYLEYARSQAESARAAAEAQDGEVLWARDRLTLRDKELEEALEQVQTLERLRDRRLREHELERDRREESDRDDASIQGWNNRG